MTPVLETGRFLLRVPTAEDAPAIAAFYVRNREHAGRWSPARGPEYFTAAYWASQARQDQEAANQRTSFRFWAFAEGKAVATIILRAVTLGANMAADIGYTVDQDHCGQGAATEITSAVIRFAFDELHLHRLEAVHMPANVASARVLAKLGFEMEGILRDMLFIEGRWEDHFILSLINPDSRKPTL